MAASERKHNSVKKQIVLMFIVMDDWYMVILDAIVGVAAAKQQYQAVKVFRKNMQNQDV